MRRRGVAAVLLAFAIVAWFWWQRSSLLGAAPEDPAAGEAEAGSLHYIERITGGASASDSLPLVIALHGLRGRPERIAAALSSLSVPARVILPRGPERVGLGYAWIDPNTPEAQLSARTRAAADRLAAMIVEIQAKRPYDGRTVVVGFSQGGLLSYALAVLHPELVRAAVPVAGWLPRALVPNPWPAHVTMPRVRAIHGTADTTVPIELDRDTVSVLQRVGFRIDLTELPAEHAVTPEVKSALTRAITDALAE